MCGQKVFEEIGRHIQIVLDNDDKIETNLKGGVQCPAIVTSYLVVALELLLLGQHKDVALIWLLDERELAAKRLNCLLGGCIAAILRERDLVNMVDQLDCQLDSPGTQ